MHPFKKSSFEAARKIKPLEDHALHFSTKELVYIYGREQVTNFIKQIKSSTNLRQEVLEFRSVTQEISIIDSKIKNSNPEELPDLKNEKERLLSQYTTLNFKLKEEKEGLTFDELYNYNYINYLEFRKLEINAEYNKKTSKKDFYKDESREIITKITEIAGLCISDKKSIQKITELIKKNFKKIYNDVLLSSPKENSVDYITDVFYKAIEVLIEIAKLEYFDKIESDSFAQMFYEIIKIIIYPNYNGEIVIGLGGSVDYPNARLCSYVIPALELQKIFLKNEVNPPVLKVLNGYSMAVSLNNLDLNEAKKISILNGNILKDFINEFYSELNELVYYTFPTESDFINNKAYKDISTSLFKFYNENQNNKHFISLIKKAHRHNEHLSNIKFEDLTEEQKKDLAEKAINYLTCHLVDSGSGNVNAVDDGVNTKKLYLIEMGGKGEKDFNYFKKYIMQHDKFNTEPDKYYIPNNFTTNQKISLQLVYNFGGTPPVYYNLNSENTIFDLNEGQNFHSLEDHYNIDSLASARKDMEVFSKSGIDQDKYVEFLLNEKVKYVEN